MSTTRGKPGTWKDGGDIVYTVIPFTSVKAVTAEEPSTQTACVAVCGKTRSPESHPLPSLEVLRERGPSWKPWAPAGTPPSAGCGSAGRGGFVSSMAHYGACTHVPSGFKHLIILTFTNTFHGSMGLVRKSNSLYPSVSFITRGKVMRRSSPSSSPVTGDGQRWPIPRKQQSG